MPSCVLLRVVPPSLTVASRAHRYRKAGCWRVAVGYLSGLLFCAKQPHPHASVCQLPRTYRSQYKKHKKKKKKSKYAKTSYSSSAGGSHGASHASGGHHSGGGGGGGGDGSSSSSSSDDDGDMMDVRELTENRTSFWCAALNQQQASTSAALRCRSPFCLESQPVFMAQTCRCTPVVEAVAFLRHVSVVHDFQRKR